MKSAKHFLSLVGRTISILGIAFILWSTGSSGLRPPFQDGNPHGGEMTFGQRAFSISRLNVESSAPFGLYVPPPKDPAVPEEESQEDSSEKKQRLANIMRARYQEFRRNLEESAEQQPEPFRGHTRQGASPRLPLASNRSSRPSPYDLSALQTPREKQRSSTEGNAPALPSLDITKRLRSPDEVHSPVRSAGIPPQAHPFVPLLTGAQAAPLNTTEDTEEDSEDVSDASSTHQVLEERLGPSATPSFDPSIVVDFSGLLQLTRQSQRFQKTRDDPPARSSLSKLALREGPTTVIIKPKSSLKGMKIVRRRLDNVPYTVQTLSPREPPPPKPVAKRAKYLQMPSNVGTNSTMKEDLSLYIATSSQPEGDKRENPERESKESLFGPYSQGNDPTAGLPPSEVKVPDLDLSQVVLPQGVRDSLRKYLKPLISALKPLRKSVPGLPGLDYPILSVVPYTNFYCSNMPWPGFYADTEARCQTWHACDVDGRQATFLCPNGTVFNQALMVCDWWYNTDCLASPFLYPLNERLFGTLKPEPVTLHTRITPELLDTIFV